MKLWMGNIEFWENQRIWQEIFTDNLCNLRNVRYFIYLQKKKKETHER